MTTALPQREFETILPIGFANGSGTTHRRAVIRKMRGHEEALLYDATLSASELVTELIRGCLLRVGDIDAIDANLVTGLYTADRNYLLLEIRRITLGDGLIASYLCPGCGSDVQVMEDLSEVEVRRLGDDEELSSIVLNLEDGYVDRDGVLHTDLQLRLPRGIDEDFVARMVERDPLKAQDALTLRCVERFGTLSRMVLEAYGVKILRDLTLGDRMEIDRAFSEQAPGVDLNRLVTCQACGRAFVAVLDTSHFFSLSPVVVTGYDERSFISPITSIGHGNRL